MTRPPHLRTSALLLAGALALTACGRAEPEDAANDAESLSDGPATGTITVWAMGGEGENLPELAEGFEEANPDADVEVTPVPWDAAHDKISTAIAGDSTPDVAMVGTTWMAEFAATGALEATPPEFEPDAYFPALWESTVVDDTSYAVPWYGDTRLMYFRSDLAEDADAEAPTTWEETREFGQALHEEGADQGVSVFPGGIGSWQTFLPFYWQAGGDILDGDGDFDLDNEAMVEALEYYQSLFDDGLSSDTRQDEVLEPHFVEGRIGSFYSGAFHGGLLNEVGGEDFDEQWDVAPMPEAATTGAFAGGGNLVVFDGAGDRDSAWKLVDYLSDPGVQAEWYGIQSALPSVREAWDLPEMAEDERLALFGEQLETAIAPPAIPNWEQVAAVMESELELAVRGGQSAEETAASIQSQAESIGTGE